MRKSWDQLWMNFAVEMATMGTCARRKVGCVLVDEKNKIISTGFNGVPPGWPHCNESAYARCPGADAISGTRLDECYANHAEVNALLHCDNVYRIKTCYVTSSPCVHCVKQLLHTSCTRIVFSEEYSHQVSGNLWVSRSNRGLVRSWEHFNLELGSVDRLIASAT